MTDTHTIIYPRKTKLPILISCPHVGTTIPSDIANTMLPGIAEHTADTDWFIHELYGFAHELGITMIRANYSRYVIDLNRDPLGKNLYNDQRQQTALVPLKTFSGDAIYQTGELSLAEVDRRRFMYFDPYHAAIKTIIKGLRMTYNHVLFFDAHSIKRLVPSIKPDPFPDLILGDNQRKTADARLAQSALDSLKNAGDYSVSYNTPFMGGFLTRSIGQPTSGIHALQLEMSQDLYMNEEDNTRNPDKQMIVAQALEKMFVQLADVLKELNR